VRSEEARAEQALVRAAQAGDRDAFDRLAVRLLPRLLGTAHRLLGDPVEAEEVVAAALVRVHAALPGFRGASALSTWAHRILCRLAADRVGVLQRRRERERSLPDGLGADREQEPIRVASRREDARRIRRLVEALPTAQRLVLVLVAWESVPLAEAAQLLGMRYATAKSNLHHARLALRAAWGRRGSDA
jgi:RNA polymerase sigma-70 factor (ECF subfamily)